MDPIWLLLLLPLAAASGWFAASTSKFSWFRRRKLPAVYFEGINYLLNDQHDKAIELFLDMLEVDSKTIEIHLTLGKLYRKRGEIERATLIHENLIDRSDLTSEQRNQSYFELGRDFYAAGILDRAERIFTELMKDPEYQEQAHKNLIEIYEQEREWNNCIKVTNSLNQVSSNDYSSLLAQYYCEMAEEAIREGRYTPAEDYVEVAKAVDKNCVRAILQSGRIKALRGDHKSAIDTWRTIGQKNSRFVPETVSHVAESYKILKQTDELVEFLRATAEAATDGQLAVAYVDALESQNRAKSAEKFLTDWTRKYPSLHCLHRLILLKLKASEELNNSDEFKLIEKLIQQEIDAARLYQCQRCGYTTRTLHWQCPGCRSWNTIVGSHSPKLTVGKALLEADN